MPYTIPRGINSYDCSGAYLNVIRSQSNPRLEVIERFRVKGEQIIGHSIERCLCSKQPGV